MIAQLTGTVARAAAPIVVLDVNGVGYRVGVPLSVLERLPVPGSEEKVTLLTHLIVREDDLSLYGFLEEMELKVFELAARCYWGRPQSSTGHAQLAWW
ncbi:MAG: OB-fold domain-containing protein [Armatimonas sp.]